jgi:hypothetical protein
VWCDELQPVEPCTVTRECANTVRLPDAVVVNNQAIRHLGEIEVQLHSFINSSLDGDEWLASRSGSLNDSASERVRNTTTPPTPLTIPLALVTGHRLIRLLPCAPTPLQHNAALIVSEAVVTVATLHG